MVANYRDPSHIKDGDVSIDLTKLFPQVETLTKYIREKMYGIDVREALALALELMSNIVSDDIASYETLKNEVDYYSQRWHDDSSNLEREWQSNVDDLKNRWSEAVSQITDFTEVIEARRSLDGTSNLTLKEHLDKIESNNFATRDSEYLVEENTILQVKDLTQDNKDLHYQIVHSTEDLNDIQFALETLMSSGIRVIKIG